MGVTEEQLRDMSRYRESPAFDDQERLVIDLAVEMTKAPVSLPADLKERLRERFDEAQLVELAAAIAWENYRGRFNRVFGVEPVGFSEGAFCALPERAPEGG
jgi:alkylhydroperoxidase family enzyme